MGDLISRLSELRCQYNCFDENERDAYHTLSEAIKALSDVPDTNASDTISRQAAIDAINEDKIDLTNPTIVAFFKATGDFEKAETQAMTCDRHIKILKDLPSAQPEPSQVARDIATIIENEKDMRVIAAQSRKTAEWIYGEKDGADGWYCSKCGFHIPWYYDYYGLNNINFIRDFHTCPHCDSKMMKYTGMNEVT